MSSKGSKQIKTIVSPPLPVKLSLPVNLRKKINLTIFFIELYTSILTSIWTKRY